MTVATPLSRRSIAARTAARARWGYRILRLDALSAEKRAIVLALVALGDTDEKAAPTDAA